MTSHGDRDDAGVERTRDEANQRHDASAVIESKTIAHDHDELLPAEGATTKPKKSKSVKTNGTNIRALLPPFVGFGATWLSLLYWAITLAIVVLSWVGVWTIEALNDRSSYGLFARWSSSCKSFSPITGRYGNVILALNIATAVVITASDHFRTQVVAPSPAEFQRNQYMELGAQSWTAFRKSSWLKKGIYVVLMLTSIPFYFLSNSLLYVKYSASNNYEVVMSTSYLNGRTFNLSALSMSQWPRDEWRTLPSPDAEWPADYTRIPQLASSLLLVQGQPSAWVSLSRRDCASAYNKAEYTTYRTLIVVTNYTAPEHNNSALSIGVLPGYRLSTRAKSLLALCPDIYLTSYNNSRRPTATPYLSALSESEDNTPSMMYVDPDQARHQAQFNISEGLRDMPEKMAMIMSGSLSQGYKPHILSPSNVLPDIDLCYHYWDIRWNEKREYLRPRADFSYCLAEPVNEDERTCEAVYNIRILYAVATTLTVKFLAMTAALFLRCTSVVFTRWNDALDYYDEKGIHMPRYYSGAATIWQATHHAWRSKYVWAIYAFMFAWSVWLFFALTMPSLKHYPSSKSDSTWFLGVVIIFRMLHIYHNMLTYIQQNDFAHLAASIERADHTPSTPGFWPALCSLHKDLQTHLVPLFALRSIFVHVLINWFYNIRFLQVETLARGEAPPVVFGKLGFGTWNASNGGIYGHWAWGLVWYAVLCVLLFQIVPVALFYVAYGVAYGGYRIARRRVRGGTGECGE